MYRSLSLFSVAEYGFNSRQEKKPGYVALNHTRVISLAIVFIFLPVDVQLSKVIKALCRNEKLLKYFIPAERF